MATLIVIKEKSALGRNEKEFGYRQTLWIIRGMKKLESGLTKTKLCMGINDNSFICKYYETQQKFLKYFALLYKCNKKQKYGFLTVNRNKK